MTRSLGILTVVVLAACLPGQVISTKGGVDSGSSDSGFTPDGGDGGCPYQYCEDFEGYDAGVVVNAATLGPWKASVSGVGTQVWIDSVNPKSGSKSFHVTLPSIFDGGSGQGKLNQQNLAGLVPGNDVFGRAEIFYSDFPSDAGDDAGIFGLPLNVHSWVFAASGVQQDGGGSNLNMGGGGDKLQLNYHYHAGSPAEQSVQGGMITSGAWHCLQWEFDGSGDPPANVARVWIDGTLAVNVPVTQGWTFPTPWNSFDFGFTHYQHLTNPVDVYLDDFALDGAMIPCP